MMMGTPSTDATAIVAPKEKMRFAEDMTEAEAAKLEGATPAGLQTWKYLLPQLNTPSSQKYAGDARRVGRLQTCPDGLERLESTKPQPVRPRRAWLIE